MAKEMERVDRKLGEPKNKKTTVILLCLSLSLSL
jgi:hypothetical protein